MFNRKMYCANDQSFKLWFTKECRILSKRASEAANNQIGSEKEKKEIGDAEGLGAF